MNKLAILFVILIVAGIGIEAALLTKIFNFPGKINPTTQPAVVKNTVKNIAPIGKAVIIVKVTDNGFSPNNVNAKVGDKIIWTNSSKTDVTVNSDSHPIHDLYPFLNLGQFPPGGTVRVIMKETGKFSYHNHLIPSQTGTIVVK
jgi:plastocyanin